jgi:hypothetical protein
LRSNLSQDGIYAHHLKHVVGTLGNAGYLNFCKASVYWIKLARSMLSITPITVCLSSIDHYIGTQTDAPSILVCFVNQSILVIEWLAKISRPFAICLSVQIDN